MSKRKDAEAVAQDIFGHCGRLLSQSKSAYWGKHPTHTVVFNSNLCTKKLGKIWFGDIDVTLEKDKIDTLAKRLDAKVYVLYEMDARFENEKKPLLDRAVYVTP